MCDNEAYILKLEKENMELRSGKSVQRSNYTLNLKKDPSFEHQMKIFEEKLAELDVLNEVYHQKTQKIQKIKESLVVKEKWIEHKEKELKASWQNFEKTKHD